jgi:hypothetical protein
MYLNVFMIDFNIFLIYFNVCIIYSNVFRYVYWQCAPTYTFVFHCPQQFFSQHALSLYYFLLFPLIHSNFYAIYEKNYINPYFSHLYITPHSTFQSTFHVVTSCVDHSRAQVCFNKVGWFKDLYKYMIIMFLNFEKKKSFKQFCVHYFLYLTLYFWKTEITWT